MKSGISYLLAAVMLVLASCAPRATTEHFEAALNRWVGKPFDDLVVRIGPPNSSFKLDDGNTVYQWNIQNFVTTGGGITSAPVTNYGTGTTVWVPVANPAVTHNLYCNVRIITAPDKTIVSWAYDGNACRLPPPDKK